MIRIGYVRYDASDARALSAAGCEVVRAEESPCAAHVLTSILEFIGEGDRLVVRALDRLGGSGRTMLSVVERLEAKGASLEVLEPSLCSEGAGGQALRAVLEAVAAAEPARAHRAAAEEIRALQQAGVGPVEIARRLGVSRMTVWRKLKAVEA